MATKNPNVKRGYTQLSLTQQEQDEFNRCASNPLYFIQNYIYVRHPVRGKTLFELYPYQQKLIKTYHENKEVITLFPRQSGKDLEISTELLTPNGFKQIRDIHPGDYVYGDTGTPVLVIDESIVFTDHPLYKVTFDDGTSVNASATHQWTVYNQRQAHTKSTLTTEQILNSEWRLLTAPDKLEYSYYIPNTLPIEFPTQELLIDPYLLGCWLGEHASATSTVSTEHAIQYRLMQPNTTHKIKHIPACYQLSTREDRIRLLQGLMDTDGDINQSGTAAVIKISNENDTLLKDVQQLLWSLGLKNWKHVVKNTTTTQLTFIVGRDHFDLFSIPYKLSRQPNTINRDKYAYSRIITNIEYLGNTTETKCISVDNDSHLFLATKALIPTHNSETSCAYLFWAAIFQEDKTILITSNKHKNAREMVSRIKYMYENLANFLKPGVTDDGWNALSLIFETGSRIMSDATSETTGRGGSFSMLYCLSGETTVTIRNKKTGDISIVPLQDMPQTLRRDHLQ